MTTFTTYQPSMRPTKRSSVFTWRMAVIVAIPLLIIGAMLHAFLEPDVKDLGNGWKAVDLKWMSSFNFPQASGTMADIPQDRRELDGQKVVLYGEIWQPNEAGNGKLDSFQLCYSITKCCFAGPPQVQHFVQAVVPADVTAYSYPNLVKVSGILHVKAQYDAEAKKVMKVYSLDVAGVEPAG